MACCHELTYRQAVQAFGEYGAAELIYLVGVYCLVSVTLNGFDVPVPEPTFEFAMTHLLYQGVNEALDGQVRPRACCWGRRSQIPCIHTSTLAGLPFPACSAMLIFRLWHAHRRPAGWPEGRRRFEP